VDSGKTRSGDGDFTLLWCSSKPACCRLVAPLTANELLYLKIEAHDLLSASLATCHMVLDSVLAHKKE